MDETPRGDGSEIRRGILRARSVLFTMGLVASSAVVVSMLVLYRAGLSEQQERLAELALNQSELIDAIARFDEVESQDAHPAGAWVATLGQVANAYRRRHRGEPGLSLAIAGPSPNGPVVHVFNGRLLSPAPEPLPEGYPRLPNTWLETPGSLEYRSGSTGWLLVHAPIPALGMATLVRLDLEEFRRPFRQGMLISGLASLVLIGLGIALLQRTGVRNVEGLREELRRRRLAEVELQAHRDDLERVVEQRTAELKRAQEELLRGERLATIGQITAKVSHELRNPLATLRTSLHVLRERTRGVADLERAFERCDRNVLRCDRIIEELLTYSRAHVPAMELLDLSVLLVDTLDEYEGTLRSNMVAIERDIPPGIQLRAGAEDLRRMLVNLLSNAEDATREKQLAGVAVHLSLRETAEAVEIRVSDQGVGMSAQVIADAFTPLFSTKGFGIGLGLTIVKELAERNGGTVTLSSEEGRGTTALLRFSREPART